MIQNDTFASNVYRLMADLQGMFWYLLTDAQRAAVMGRLEAEGQRAALALLLLQIDAYYHRLHPGCAAQRIVQRARRLRDEWPAATPERRAA